jgi:hypothetical protein
MGLSDYLRGSVEGDGGGVASYATDAPPDDDGRRVTTAAKSRFIPPQDTPS